MIPKIDGFNDIQANTGEFQSLPRGKYICVIKDTEFTYTKTNRPMLIIKFDIAQGEFKNYYSNKFNDDVERNINAKWQGFYRQLIDGSSLSFYKGMLENIRKSNPSLENMDFSNEWEEKILINKLFGALMSGEEYLTDTGEKRIFIKCVGIRSIEGLEKAKVPDDKLLKEDGQNDFYKINDTVDDDNLPF